MFVVVRGSMCLHDMEVKRYWKYGLPLEHVDEVLSSSLKEVVHKKKIEVTGMSLRISSPGEKSEIITNISFLKKINNPGLSIWKHNRSLTIRVKTPKTFTGSSWRRWFKKIIIIFPTFYQGSLLLEQIGYSGNILAGKCCLYPMCLFFLKIWFSITTRSRVQRSAQHYGSKRGHNETPTAATSCFKDLRGWITAQLAAVTRSKINT